VKRRVSWRYAEAQIGAIAPKEKKNMNREIILIDIKENYKKNET
jgi:hypothetical protein